MGLFDRFFKSYLTKLERDLRISIGTEVNNKILESVRNRPVYPPDNVESYINTGYLFNPIVYSVVSFIAQKAGSIPWGVYEVKNEKSLQLYKSSAKIDINARMIRKKAMVAIEDHELSDLFVRPNLLQGWADFFEQVVGFKLVTGNSYIHAIGPTGGVNAGLLKELWGIPSQIIKPVAGDMSQPVKGYQYLTSETILPPEQVLHLKYWTPEYFNGAFLYGLSPIRAGKRVITKSNSSYDSSVSAFQNQGAFGVLSEEPDGVVSMTPEQAEQLEKAVNKKYGGASNRGKTMVTSARLKWQQMGMSPVDLNIIESDMMDLRTICNIFHVPSELFNDANNKTYSNTKEAGSAVYTNAVLPQLNQFRDAFNNFIYRRYEGKIFVDYDASMISELQEDLQKITTALSGAYWITPNEKRDLMNFPSEEDNPLMDEYWVPPNLRPLSFISLDDVNDEETVERDRN